MRHHHSAAEGFQCSVHFANSDREERSWHFLKLGVDTILFGNWYRPGASVWDGFSDLHEEMGQYFSQVAGFALAGDLNIHHRQWLRFFNDDTRIGPEIKAFCDFHGMFQVVRQPTRYDPVSEQIQYMMNLAITDFPDRNQRCYHE